MEEARPSRPQSKDVQQSLARAMRQILVSILDENMDGGHDKKLHSHSAKSFKLKEEDE